MTELMKKAPEASQGENSPATGDAGRNPLTDLMKQAIARLLELPEAEQDLIAARLLDELEAEARWDELLENHPEALERLGEEALEEFRRGETEDLDTLLK